MALRIHSLATRGCLTAPGRRASASRFLSTAARDSQTMTLADGRTLGWAEYGSPTGRPLVFLHGFPGSRLEPSGLDAAAARHDIRLLAPDRPGFGLSTFYPYTIAGWPADLIELVDHLGLERFAVVGGSGGGPFALACAASIPERLEAVGVLAGAPPWNAEAGPQPTVSRYYRALTYNAPALARGVNSAIIGTARWATGTRPVARWIDEWLAKAEKDKEYPADSIPSPAGDVATKREKFLRFVFEGYAQGSAAAVYEANLLSSDWGIDFARIAMPVKIWHGVGDSRAPIRAIRWMADQIPHATLTEFPDGHFDIHKRIDEVFEQLKS